MYARVRDILQLNYLELLGIPPSSTLKDVRRAVQRAEMEAELGFSGPDADVIEAAKAALSSEERLLEYRVLARWLGDERLAPWALAHDRALEALRAALGASSSRAVVAVRAWFEAHRDPALAPALQGPDGGNEPLWWVGDIAEDYLSAFLVPGTPTLTAPELATLDLSRFPRAAMRLVMKLIECRRAEMAEVAEFVPPYQGGQVDQNAARQGYSCLAEVSLMVEDYIVLSQLVSRCFGAPANGSLRALLDALSDLGTDLGRVALQVSFYCFVLGDRKNGKRLAERIPKVTSEDEVVSTAGGILARVRKVESLPYRAWNLVSGIVSQVVGLAVAFWLISLVTRACDSGS